MMLAPSQSQSMIGCCCCIEEQQQEDEEEEEEDVVGLANCQRAARRNSKKGYINAEPKLNLPF